MNTNEGLKTRPDFEKLAKAHVTGLYGSCDPSQRPYRLRFESYSKGYSDCWTTHVEPLQAEVGAGKIYIDTLHGRIADLKAYNEKLKESLKSVELLSFKTQFSSSITDIQKCIEELYNISSSVLKLDKTNP